MHRASLLCAALLLAASVPVVGAVREPTPATHTGPWYLPGAPAQTDLRRGQEPGQALRVIGRVVATDGQPVAGASVELWHADALGVYGELTYRSALRSDARGQFGFRSVLPGHRADDRARHVHFVISHPEYRRLVTRIYFRGDDNIAYALDETLAITLEEGRVDGETVLFGNVEFVVAPN